MPSPTMEPTSDYPKTLKTLSKCIDICADGAKGYASAAEEVRSPLLKDLCHDYSKQRTQFVRALEEMLTKLGGAPPSGEPGSTQGSIHRGLMAARFALEGRDDAVILAECERADWRALGVYDRALGHTLSPLPPEVRSLLVAQRSVIKQAHDDMLARLAKH